VTASGSSIVAKSWAAGWQLVHQKKSHPLVAGMAGGEALGEGTSPGELPNQSVTRATLPLRVDEGKIGRPFGALRDPLPRPTSGQNSEAGVPESAAGARGRGKEKLRTVQDGVPSPRMHFIRQRSRCRHRTGSSSPGGRSGLRT
jgi:hypothetical protein